MKKSSEKMKKKPEKIEDSAIALILAGGQSSRLYPFNKILSDLTGSGRTLLQQAYDRVTQKKPGSPALLGPANFNVLTNTAFIPKIRSQLHLPADHCFADPARRGTWPALLWAMAHLRRKNPNAVLAVLTADHLIPDVVAFRRAAMQAIQLAKDRPVIAMVGVSPTKQAKDWLGYGAFRRAPAAAAGEKNGRPLMAFEEKPSLERAASMIAEGGWLWNAGLFFFRIPAAEEALHVYQPQMAGIYERMAAAISANEPDEAARIFVELPDKVQHPVTPARWVDNTIDYAIVTPLVSRPESGLSAWAAVDALKQWMDVGEWTALGSVVKPDRHGNTRVGRARIGKRVRGCILAADAGVTIDVDGLSDFIVAVSGGRALIVPRARAGEIKTLVADAAGPLIGAGTAHLSIQLTKTRLRIRPNK